MNDITKRRITIDENLNKNDYGVIYGALARLIDIIERYPGWHPEKESIQKLRNVQFKIKEIIDL